MQDGIQLIIKKRKTELKRYIQNCKGKYDFSGKPDYQGHKDECARYTIENCFTMAISLKKCCKAILKEMFRSSTEFFVVCPKCGKATKMYKHLYEAKQAWNREEVSYDYNRIDKAAGRE